MPQNPQEYIKSLIKKGFTEQWIAHRANLSQSTVNRIKVGVVQYPRWNTAKNIERIYLQFAQ